ncbi:MAG: hypothetical protein ACI9LY_002837 [Arenicella sp.]|jgi:hypothetical protein
MNLFANIIGMLGTTAVVGVYFLLQIDKIDAKGLAFNLVNLIGAIFLLISLLVHFNLASFVIELFWIVASVIGLYQNFKKKAKQGS